MPRSRESALEWTGAGNRLVHDALAGLDEDAFAASSSLPGWSRRHVAAHLSLNAEAIGNLVHWAASGERTPMYSSPEQRSADIEAGSSRSGDELRAWFDESAARLASAMAALDDAQWDAAIVTAQGRTVAASETTWMRAREVLVHAVDLDTGCTFADLPTDFLVALGDDVAGKRSATGDGPALTVRSTDQPHRWEVAGTGDPVTVAAPLADLVAWLAGRGSSVDDASGAPAPTLPAWL